MGDIFTWVSANWMTIIGTAGTIVMAASLAVHAIAPLTKTDSDDKVATWLDKVYVWLNTIALNKK